MEERPKADEEYLTAAQLRQRISQPVPYCFGAEYSKLSAIARIAAAVSDGEALTEEAGRQLGREVQWLLVDRGLLFAQTRTGIIRSSITGRTMFRCKRAQACVSRKAGGSHMWIPWHAIEIWWNIGRWYRTMPSGIRKRNGANG